MTKNKSYSVFLTHKQIKKLRKLKKKKGISIQYLIRRAIEKVIA